MLVPTISGPTQVGGSLSRICIISKPPMCATIWIKHLLGIAIIASSRIKHVDWFMLGTNNKWTYDITDPLMIDLETIITLAFYDIYYRLRCL